MFPINVYVSHTPARAQRVSCPAYVSRPKASLSSSGLVGAQRGLSTADVKAISGGGGSTAGAGAATEGSGGSEEKVRTSDT